MGQFGIEDRQVGDRFARDLLRHAAPGHRGVCHPVAAVAERVECAGQVGQTGDAGHHVMADIDPAPRAEIQLDLAQNGKLARADLQPVVRQEAVVAAQRSCVGQARALPDAHGVQFAGRQDVGDDAVRPSAGRAATDAGCGAHRPPSPLPRDGRGRCRPACARGSQPSTRLSVLTVAPRSRGESRRQASPRGCRRRRVPT
jgi:hypothetical protein